MNVCRSSESIWYISHLLIIHVEWAKISWLSYRRVCPTLISQTFCKWGYYAKNKAEWTSTVWRASEKRGPHSYTCHLQTRLHYGFQRGNIAPSPLRQCLSSGNRGSLVIVRLRQNQDVCFSRRGRSHCASVLFSNGKKNMISICSGAIERGAQPSFTGSPQGRPGPSNS